MAVPGTHWQLECENATQRCGYLLTSGIWSDCIFMVGTETNQEAIQAHKIVLAMASPVFEALFYGGLAERNNPIVRIPDIQPEAFRALLQYIHTGNIKIGSLDMAWDVLYGAKKYMLPHLEKKSVEYICSVLGPKNACRAYELARLFDDKTIMGKCLQIISTNTKEVLNDSSFMDLEVNTVITVFALDHLNVDSELDLYHALARFAEAEQKRHEQISPEGGHSSEKLSDGVLQNVESSCQTSPALGLDSKTPTEVLTSKLTAEKETLKEVTEKPTIRTALQEIRFLTLTARQFAVGPASSELLTKDQSYSILMNILCDRDSAVPMPSGFSTCREWRQPRRDRIRHCYKTRSLDHIITALTCGNLSQVEEAAWAARNIMRESHLIQRALDEGILVALVPALTEGNDGCKHNAVCVITYFCASGSASQLRALAEGAALQPYCRQLAGGGNTCYRVMCGLTGLLERIERNTKRCLVGNLRYFGVPQLLKTVQQDGDENYRALANKLLQTYFSDGQ